MTWLDGFYDNLWLRVVRQNRTTLGLEVNGSSISNSYTIATIPAASAVELGTVIRIPKSEFTNSGGGAAAYMPAWGIYLQSDGTNWCPAFGSQLFACVNTGTETSPILSGVVAGTPSTATAFALASGCPIIPGELMYIGLRVRAEMIMGKGTTSTAGSIPMVLLGNSATLASNAAMITGETLGNATTLRQSHTNSFATITSSTQFSAPSGGSGGSSLIPNAGSANNQNAGADAFQTYTTITLAASGKNYVVPAFWTSGATDTHSLYYFRVWLEA